VNERRVCPLEKLDKEGQRTRPAHPEKDAVTEAAKRMAQSSIPFRNIAGYMVGPAVTAVAQIPKTSTDPPTPTHASNASRISASSVL
jgi:hypothetical protein